MNVLVACEFSGNVREAFRDLGHNAVSVDYLPSERAGPHVQGDVRPLLRERWDLVVAFPPCTFLSAAAKQYVLASSAEYRPKRLIDVDKAISFFNACLDANAPLVAVENPPMHPVARRVIGPPSDRVQPWHFGDAATKATHFWTRGPIPPLMPTRAGDRHGWSMKVASGNRRVGTSQWRIARRIRPGMAAAMAAQWGSIQLDGVTDSAAATGSVTEDAAGFDLDRLQALATQAVGGRVPPGFRRCSWCGTPFVPKRWIEQETAFDSSACRQAAHRWRHRGEAV